MAHDNGMTVEGPDEEISKALLNLVSATVHEQGGFRFIHDSLKDGLVGDNGTGKGYWKNIFGQPEKYERGGLTQEEIERLRLDPEIEINEVIPEEPRYEIIDTGQVGPLGIPIQAQVVIPQFTVRMVYRELKETGVVLDNIPADELLFGRFKRRINDRHPAGHRKKVTLGDLKKMAEQYGEPGKPYYTGLSAVSEGGSMTDDEKDDERRDYERPFVDYVDIPNTVADGDLRMEVELIEWYDQIIQDGKLQSAILTFANGELIRAEKNEDGFLPLFTWSPILNPHRVVGTSLSGSHVDIHNLETVMFRALLDSIAFSIDKPRIVKPGNTDLLAMQNLTPGRLIVGDKDAVHEIDIAPLDSRLFGVLEHLKGMSENRGPVTRYNQGTDAGSLNKTATGINLIQQAAFTRIDMIALIYAETFMADCYQKIIRLFQKNMIKPEEIMVDGKTVVLTREKIQGDYKVKASLGVEVDFNEREFGKMSAVLDRTIALTQQFPMFYPLGKIYNVVRKWYIGAGIKDPDNFLAPPPQQLRDYWPGSEKFPVQGQGDAIGQDAQGGMTSTPDESIFGEGGA